MGLDEESDSQMPFLDPNYVSSSSSQSSKLVLKRTGLAHIITAVIGSGVLSLAWSMAQLGWIAGPLTMLVFACVSLTSVFLLCNCYKSPDPETGPDRNGCYLDAVQKILGKRNAWFCGIAVRINFIKLAIVYTITSASSIQAIQKSNCYHDQGHKATCGYESTSYCHKIFTITSMCRPSISGNIDNQTCHYLKIPFRNLDMQKMEKSKAALQDCQVLQLLRKYGWLLKRSGTLPFPSISLLYFWRFRTH
ncbi:hypothetical protein AABB24_033662 [Solanum stoloniferum]|uniref:Amino acid transporter transmembrane domain-containing protein n=1 Tax=Solanum stoloniferum TaxID=62892 RepID=A0ABD2RPA7_9SOLN